LARLDRALNKSKRFEASIKLLNKIMNIRQPVINTFDRVGIDYQSFEHPVHDTKVEVANWISGETCMVHPLIRECIEWVYRTQLKFDRGTSDVKISDFDRVRHWILEVDSNAYSTCID
jgi:hypothetical protein